MDLRSMAYDVSTCPSSTPSCWSSSLIEVQSALPSFSTHVSRTCATVPFVATTRTMRPAVTGTSLRTAPLTSPRANARGSTSTFAVPSKYRTIPASPDSRSRFGVANHPATTSTAKLATADTGGCGLTGVGLPEEERRSAGRVGQQPSHPGVHRAWGDGVAGDDVGAGEEEREGLHRM